MRRMSLLLAALTLVLGASGCNCFRKRQQVAAPAPMAVCPPVMACPPAYCDPCAQQGVTYGMPAIGYATPTQ